MFVGSQYGCGGQTIILKFPPVGQNVQCFCLFVDNFKNMSDNFKNRSGNVCDRKACPTVNKVINYMQHTRPTNYFTPSNCGESSFATFESFVFNYLQPKTRTIRF